MNVVWHPVPAAYFIETGFAFRPPSGVVLHSTEADAALSFPHNAPASWTYEITRDGVVHGFVPEADVAFHTKAWGSDPAVNKWRPPWLPLTRPWNASATNCHTLGIELVSSQKWRNQGTPYTKAQYRALQLLLLDLRSRYGALPVVGHGHVQSDKGDPWWLDWATVLPVLPETDATMPLAGARRSDPLLGGYAFAQWTGSVFHPGVDLNAGAGGDADLGTPVRPPVEGPVRFVGRWDGHTTGEGNHVWIEAVDGHWHHFDHLDEVLTREGDYARPDLPIGTCGKTGNWAWAHTHWEVTYAKPADWWQWPVGWSKARVLEAYMDPFAYLAATLPTGTATGGGGTMDEPLLDDAELAHKQMALEWGALYPGDGAVGFAIPKRWREELRLGHQLGSPTGPEEAVPDVPDAVSQPFQHGRIYARKVGDTWKTSLVA